MVDFKKYSSFRRKLIIVVLSIILIGGVSSVVAGYGVSHAQGNIEISGVVTNPSGSGLANVTVTATNPGDSTVEYGPVTTSSEGSYTLYVDSGTYDFHFTPALGSGFNNVTESNVSVTSNQTEDVQFSAATNTLSGIATDSAGNPIVDAEVILNAADGNTSSTFTSANGSYSVAVTPDVYSLTFQSTNPVDSNLSQFYLTPSGTVNLTNGNVTQNLQLETATIDVTVEDANGNPIPNATVTATDQNNGTTSLYPGDPGENIDYELSDNNDNVNTNANGTADITTIVGSKYASSYNGGSICADISGSEVCIPQPLTVSGNTDIVIQLSNPTSVPTITSSSIQQIDARIPANVTITTTGSPTASITESGTLPTGISFTDNGNATATLSGQASTTNNGLYALNITATNSAGSTTQTMYLSVDDQTSVPTFLSNNSLTETAGTPFSFTVNTTGDPIPNINKQSGSGSLPAGVTLKDNNDGTATLSGNLSSANDYGVYSFTIQAKNNQGTATQPFTLTILAPPTVANIPNQTTSVGTSFSQAVTTTGYPIASLSASGLPAGLSLTDNGNGTGTITGTPTTGSGGVYTVTVSATNSEGTSSNTFTLKVNEGPVITSAASASTTIGTAFSFQVTATGYPSPTYSETGTLPTGITFKAGQGILSGTARTGTSGTYPITITTSNSTGTVSQSFVLTVE